jgi:hypothetical protein
MQTSPRGNKHSHSIRDRENKYLMVGKTGKLKLQNRSLFGQYQHNGSGHSDGKSLMSEREKTEGKN